MISLFLVSLTLSFAQAPTPGAVMSNREGIAALRDGNPGAAQGKFIESLSVIPFEPRVHLNLGLSFEQLNQADKAQASYEAALKLASDDEVRFMAEFNLGVLAQKAKKKDEALTHYQKALRFQPESLETKVNIELLTQDQKGGGGGEQDQQDQKDKQDQSQNNQGQDQKKDQNQNPNQQNDKDQQGDKNQDKKYAKNKPQPQQFKSQELTQGDVNKILGEIKQQEQKIRADFNKREVKEQPRDKDW